MIRALPWLLVVLSGCTTQGRARVVPYDGGITPGGTYYDDVQPLVYDHCVQCHNEGGIAPFPLVTYEDTLAKSDLMKSAVACRRSHEAGCVEMPPWPPEEKGCQPLAGSRRLSDAQVDTILAWNLAGSPPGVPPTVARTIPSLPALPAVTHTFNAAAYTPPEKEEDDYHCSILDLQLTGDENLTGFEVVPGVRGEVHHVILFGATLADAAAADARGAGPGWTCFGGPGTPNPVVLGGWVPGTPPTVYPAGTGLPLKPGMVIVLQVHYNTAAVTPSPDVTQVKLQTLTSAVPRPARILALRDDGFMIPPGAKGYATTQSLTTPADVTVWGVLPHMHKLGRTIDVQTPEGCLVQIPGWQFSWQQMYFFAAPGGVSFKKGSTATLRCTWDNPGSVPVVRGEGTGDEMCLSYFYVTQ